MNNDLKQLTDDELLSQLTSWASRIAAGEAKQLVLLGEFDAREAYLREGLASCAQWAAWKLGLTRGAAREKVRIARALRELPRLTEQMLQGQVSYSQARAVTRVATAGDEQMWIDLARVTTGSQLERTVQAVRRVRAGDDPTQRVRQDLTYRHDDNGDLLITARVAAVNAAAVKARIERAQQAEQAELSAKADVAEGVSAETLVDQDEPRATLGDGLVRALTRPESLKPTTVQLLVDPLSGWARTSKNDLLSPTTLRQVLASLPGRGATRDPLIVRPMTPADLTVANHGRTQRLVGPALRRLLGQLDGERCRFPGCDHVRDLHAHHVLFWSVGGRTDLANLVLVCARHHTLIHREGFQLVLSPDRTLTVRTVDDIPVPQHPASAHGSADELAAAVGEIQPYSSDWTNQPFDLGFVVWSTLQRTR